MNEKREPVWVTGTQVMSDGFFFEVHVTPVKPLTPTLRYKMSVETALLLQAKLDAEIYTWRANNPETYLAISPTGGDLGEREKP